MKSYPSIPRCLTSPDTNAYVFYKADGSNIRIEYSCKRGWFRFGTRHRLFDKTDPVIGAAVDIFKENLAPTLDKALRDRYNQCDAMAFCEFFGRQSFAGHHVPNDEKRLVLIDVNIHKKGILGPTEFLDVFAQHNLSAHYFGEFTINDNFVQKIRDGQIQLPADVFQNEIFEGVVCKWGDNHNLSMMKIKTRQYLQALRDRFGNNWQTYE